MNQTKRQEVIEEKTALADEMKERGEILYQSKWRKQ